MRTKDQENSDIVSDDDRNSRPDGPGHNPLDEEAYDQARARDAVRDLWGILRGA